MYARPKNKVVAAQPWAAQPKPSFAEPTRGAPAETFRCGPPTSARLACGLATGSPFTCAWAGCRRRQGKRSFTLHGTRPSRPCWGITARDGNAELGISASTRGQGICCGLPRMSGEPAKTQPPNLAHTPAAVPTPLMPPLAVFRVFGCTGTREAVMFGARWSKMEQVAYSSLHMPARDARQSLSISRAFPCPPYSPSRCKPHSKIAYRTTVLVP